MLDVNTKLIQDKITEFRADEKFFFAVGNQKYDQVFQVKGKQREDGQIVKSVEPALNDIDHAIQDCYEMKELLEKYDFEFKKENCIILENGSNK